MQTILIMGIIIEGILLLALGLIKKLTGKVFMVITLITILCSVVLIGLQIGNRNKSEMIDQRENLYISIRLLEEDYNEEAMDALALVIDSQCEDYQVEVVRGLILNQNEYYNTAILYLENNTDEFAERIYDASLREMSVEETDKEEIIESTKQLLAVSDDEAEAWDARMKLLYIGLGTDVKIDEKDAIVSAKAAIKDQRYREAYRIMQDAAASGGIREDIIVSAMYSQNYNLRSLEDDYEYDELWKSVTQLQVQLNKLSVELQEEKSNQEKSTANSEVKVTNLEKEYNRVYADYLLAQQDIENEAINRAINYMEYSRPDDYLTNIGYQLQMSRLYFFSKQEDRAKECLDKIFAVEEIDQDQWLGTDAYLLIESFSLYLSDASSLEYRDIFINMMDHLYQGVFGDSSYNSFAEFVTEYLRALLSGIVINKIDTMNYPEVAVSVSLVNEDLVINEQSLLISDTGQDIADFQIAEEELHDLTICFVLDRSGSMSGTSMRDSKNAIQECIHFLEDFVKVGLVSFENDATLECAVTNSKYLLLSKLDGIVANGGTNIVAGLEMAYSALQNTSGKKVIVLLSDGYDSYENDSALSEILGKLRIEGIETYAVGLDGCDENYLQRISNETGGKFIPVSDTGELSDIYREIQKSLIHVYTITYSNVETEQGLRFFNIRYRDTFAQTKKIYTTIQQEEIQMIPTYLDIQMSDYYKQIGGTER